MWVKKARRGLSCSTNAMDLVEVGVGGVGLAAQGVEDEDVEILQEREAPAGMSLMSVR